MTTKSITTKQIDERDAFTSYLCHEILTPLTAMRGFVYLLNKQYASKLNDPEFTDLVSNIDQAVMKLMGTVEEFRDVLHVDQGRVVFHKTSFVLADLVREITTDLSARLKEKELTCALQDETGNATVTADRDVIKKVLGHLISNAIQFSNKGVITVTLKNDNNGITVLVSDHGIGIEAGVVMSIFEKPSRNPDGLYTKSSSYGPGLGLYISKHLINLMGGELAVSSTATGQGTTMALSFPHAPP